MRHFFVCLFIALAVPSIAQAQPIPGIYRSTDLGGDCLTGRLTQSWEAPHRERQGRGDVLYCGSWDGSSYGGQWQLHCAEQHKPYVASGGLDEWGNGWSVYRSSLVGGQFSLAPGRWGSGTGRLIHVEVVDSTRYYSNLPAYSFLTLEADGHFNEGGTFFHLSIGFAPAFTSDEIIAPDYPSFLDPDCNPTRHDGLSADVEKITFSIDWAVPVMTTTWGQLKEKYR